MATSGTTLIQRARRFLVDWPEDDSLTASVSNSTTSIPVADSTVYANGWIIQVDTEVMQVRAKPDGTHLTVLRGARGSAAASHGNAASILVNPRFTDLDYLEAFNSAIQSAWPLLYVPIVDQSIATANAVYEYNIPNGPDGTPIRAISRLQFLESGDLTYRNFGAWDVMRGATPFLKLRRPLPLGQLRIHGFSAMPPLSSPTDTLSTLFPVNAEDYLTLYAAQYLTASGEAYRVRQDTGPNDDREAANKPGASIYLSSQVYARARQRLLDSAMPPMPKHTLVAL